MTMYPVGAAAGDHRPAAPARRPPGQRHPDQRAAEGHHRDGACDLDLPEQALAARHAEQFEDKKVIACRLCDELPEDGVVVLDSGSLTLSARRRCRGIGAWSG
jgi:hypothetical protein